MILKTFAAAAAASFAVLISSTSAMALCGTISQKATGGSREVAIAKANAAGKVEVRKLERTYGRNGVRYQPAKVSCISTGIKRGGLSLAPRSAVECTITQKFCTR